MAGPIVSEDGRWIWTGSKWIPASPSSPPPPIIPATTRKNPHESSGLKSGIQFVNQSNTIRQRRNHVMAIGIALMILLVTAIVGANLFARDSSDSVSEIWGCMDPKARNYNSTANVDDGSCESVRISYIFSSYCNGNDVEFLDADWNIYADYAYMNEDGITTWHSPYITMYESNTMAFTVYSNDDTDCEIVLSIYQDGVEVAHKEAYLEANRDITLAADIEV